MRLGAISLSARDRDFDRSLKGVLTSPYCAFSGSPSIRCRWCGYRLDCRTMFHVSCRAMQDNPFLSTVSRLADTRQSSTSLVQDSSGAHSSSIQGAPVPPCLSFSSSTCIRPDRVGRRSTSLTQQLVVLQDPSRRSTCRFWPSIVTRQLQKATVEGTIVAVCNPEVPCAPFFRNKPTCYSTRVWLYSLTYSLAHASKTMFLVKNSR